MKRPPHPQLSSFDVARLIQHTSQTNISHGTAIALMHYAGLRVREATELRWTDLSMHGPASPTLLVRGCTSKSGRDRLLPLPLPLLQRLKTHYAAKSEAGNIASMDKRVLTRKQTQSPISPRAISFALTKACLELELPHARTHTFRHGFATRVLRASNLRIAQIALGHVSISTTQLYTHPQFAEIELAMTRAAFDALE